MEQQIKILYADHSIAEVDILQKLLKQATVLFDIKTVDTLSAFKKAVIEYSPKVIISNAFISDAGALDLLHFLNRYHFNIPFIVLTDPMPDGFGVKLFRAGAADYILKEEISLLPALLLKLTVKSAADTAVNDESIYKEFYENSEEGILLTNPDGTVLAANPAVCEIFGMTEKEICDSGGISLVDTGDPNFEKLLKIRHQTGEASGDLTFIRKGGAKFTAEISSRIFKNDKGEWRATVLIRDKTKKIAAEQKIRETEERYKQIVELAQEGIWVIDEHNKTSFVNQAMSRMLGYKKKEMLGKELFDFMDEQGHKIAENNIERRKQGIEEQHDFVFKTKTGSDLWAIISTTPVFKDGKYAGAMALITDITQRKLAEERINQSEDKFRALVENANDAILLLDENLITIYRSPSTSRIMGFTDEERIGRSYLELAHPDDVAKIKGFQQIVVNNPGKSISITIRAKHSNGHYLWFEGVATNLLLNKSVNAIVVNLRDISERKLTDDALLQLNSRLRIATEAANVCIWEWNIITNKLEWDKSMYTLYGVNSEKFEVSYQSWIEYVHPDDRLTIEKSGLEAINGIKNLDTEFRIIRGSDQSVRYIRSMALPVRDEKTGKTLRMIGCNWDITEKRLAEEEKEKILADFTRRNKDLEQFAYIISHNLRAPVSNVLSLSDMLINDDFDDEVKPTILNGLSLSVKKIDQIINDLNNIFQSRQLINDIKETVHLQSLVDDIKFSINNIIQKENVVLHCDFYQCDQLFTVRSYLYSVVYNLVLNSIKYRKALVAPVITISCKPEQKYFKLIIADNGKGIDLKRNQQMIFGLYQRFDPTVEGRGMGLYMVKTQVEALGGKIEVASEVNKGTVFTVSLPV